ncbi:MAG: hypothetical protein EOM24_34255 [Chloroflexia bacterium]|nr:hypothetical protein [Chloroflexia bacterium]
MNLHLSIVLFVLTQALAVFDHDTKRIAACDQELERLLATMESRGEPDAPLPAVPAAKHTSKTKNAPAPSTRAHRARSVLLERIRAEREAQGSGGTARRGRRRKAGEASKETEAVQEAL